MGVIEAIVLALYALLSTGYNVYQSNEIGGLRALNERYKAIADSCTRNASTERTNATLAANQRAAIETESEIATASHRQSVSGSLASYSDTCRHSDFGDVGNRLLDAERRLVEKLSADRLQSASE